MDKLNIFVVTPYEEKYRAELAAAAPNAEITYANPPIADMKYGKRVDLELYGETLRSADVVLGNPPVGELPNMKRLKWVQLAMAGTEPYSLPGVLPEGVLLTNSTGAFGHAISEHMAACTLTLQKKLHLYRDNMAKGEWLDRGNVVSTAGSVVLVLGLGDIGNRYARLMKALGAYTIGVRRAGHTKPEWVDEMYLSSERGGLTALTDELLPRADVVALALPNTPETTGLFNAERLGRVKPGAILLNVGRGNSVDTDALAAALESGTLGGASVDVTSPEPLPAGHPLWRAENALVTPHISGFFHLRETYENIVRLAIENVKRFAAGERLEGIVDFTTGYRETRD